MAQQFVALCRDGDLEGVRAALQGGADVNTKFADILYEAMNGLTWALINKHTEVASLLLAHEDIKADALERAKAVEFVYYCTRNELENVKSALQSGTDVNSRDEEFRNGWTGLIAALHNGFNTELSSFLLRQDGIDVNFVGGHFDHWGQIRPVSYHFLDVLFKKLWVIRLLSYLVRAIENILNLSDSEYLEKQ